MRRLIKGLIVASLISPSWAYAHDEGIGSDKFYIGLSGGLGKVRTIKSNRDFPLILKSPAILTTDINATKLTFKGSKQFAASIGCQHENLRSEVEISGINANYKKFSQDAIYFLPVDNLSGKVKVSSVLLNFYYDIHPNSSITPYIGVGTGYAKIKNILFHSGLGEYVNGTFTELPTFKASIKEKLPVYQGILGIKFNLTNHIAITSDYRMFGSIRKMKAFNSRLVNHSANVGMAYYF